MRFTLIYRANPGDKSNTGNRRGVFYCPNVAAAERRAEAILMERGVWADRGAQLWSGQGDDEHIASLHSLLLPPPWVRPKPVPGVTEKVIYTAKAYEDGRLVSYPFTAPRDTVAKRKALERFTTELSITLECKGKFVAKFKPLRGWKSTPD